MADKNNCIVCGKKEMIMKRCGRCQSIFYCSIECQRSDWGKHRNNCSITKTPDLVDGKMTQATKVDKIFDTTEKATECKTTVTDCKFRESEEDPDTIKKFVYSPTNSQVNSSQNPAKSIPSHSIDINTNILKQDSSTSGYKLENTCMSHVPTNSHDNVSKVVVYIKHAKEKHKLEIELPCTGLQALKHFSRVVHVPLERLKIIHKGKLQTELTIADKLKPSSVFLAFGERAESEEGLEAADIDLIMKQLSVQRNVAIRALRKTNCLIDAIFEIGNDIKKKSHENMNGPLEGDK
ncbi:uncharacterized protein LOC114523391 [Dendronephthya gigantea]|uniref:uncharacterized protein LOC114523391 n=1 Tax=Dendronephthya gigantea TaxID=151771 RepID=UPI00106B7117|nr:uncharacterized protein LOC114523391 [Dendronephthya gigantea]